MSPFVGRSEEASVKGLLSQPAKDYIMLGWEGSGSDSSAVHVQLCVEMVQVSDVSEELLPLFIVTKVETSAVIIILTQCCTWTKNILPHCTASTRSPSDQEWSTSFSTPLTAQELLGVCVLEVSAFSAATYHVRGSSWISKLTCCSLSESQIMATYTF
jgi:hypothetical protein